MNFPDGISIVVCTYNGSDRIMPTLQSIFSLNSDINIPWELIIVNNGSTDNTSIICNNYILKNDLQKKARLVIEDKLGCNNARLKGLYESKYKWLLFCDDDNQLFPDYIDKAWKILESNAKIGVLGGQGLPLFEKEKPDWFDHYSKSFAIGPQGKRDGKINTLSKKLYSAGSFFKKELLLNYYNNNFKTIMIGPHGNDLTRGEDTEWCILIQLLGYELWYSHELKFHHLMSENRMTWSYFLNLKKGIASGTAKLSSYTLFYKSKSPINISFILFYCYKCIYYNLIWFQFIIRNKINKKRFKKQELQIAELVNYTKAISFIDHFNLTYKHFKQIKATLKNIMKLETT